MTTHPSGDDEGGPAKVTSGEPMRNQVQDSKPVPFLANFSLVSHVGLTMASSILLCLGLGHLIENWTGREYLWKLLLLPLGVASGFWAVYSIINEALEGPKNK